MNLQEAYAILELSPGVSPEEAKKKYRELTKKYHPDINKEENADDKFKKINEAYQCVVNGSGNERDNSQFTENPFQNPFGRQRVVNAENISLHTTISFKESVLGCQRELSFSRNGKCTDCSGQGEIPVNNGCDRCNGRGQIIQRQGNMLLSRTCDKCMGRQKAISCNTCSSKGSINNQVSVNVNIPGGVTSNNILRLNGFGNYVGSFMNMDQYTEAHLHLTVTPEEGLSIEGVDVVNTLQISLLESLKGSNKNVKTILGNMDIVIPPLSKNKDEIKISSLGVNGIGCQRVILNVAYPEDVNNLIKLLSGEDMCEHDDLNKEQ